MAVDMYCTNCGTVARPRQQIKGSFLIEVMLWLCFLVPGIIYSIWRLTTKAIVCPRCGAPNMIPTASPKARAALAKVVVVALVCGAGLSAAQRQPTAVTVYVTSVGAVNGFTDPSTENQETVKDLREKIHEHKGLRLTDVREQATIVLVAERSLGGFHFALSGAHKDHTVKAKALVQGTEIDLAATAGGGYATQHPWGSAAGKVVDQLDKWVVANRAKLTEPQP
jgi:hypothetical protein